MSLIYISVPPLLPLHSPGLWWYLFFTGRIWLRRNAFKVRGSTRHGRLRSDTPMGQAVGANTEPSKSGKSAFQQFKFECYVSFRENTHMKRLLSEI